MNEGEEEYLSHVSIGVKNLQTNAMCLAQGVQFLMHREEYSWLCRSRHTGAVLPGKLICGRRSLYPCCVALYTCLVEQVSGRVCLLCEDHFTL